MKLWIARDESGLIAIYKREPYKKYDTFTRKKHWCTTSSCKGYMCLQDECFPEVTFENSPQQVEIRLVDAKMNSDFCENPFLKDTPVTIFSQGSEADDWFHRNCDKCIKNDICELQNAMLNSSSDFYCEIPLYIAKKIGIDYNPLYQQGSVYSQCREYRKGDEPF